MSTSTYVSHSVSKSMDMDMDMDRDKNMDRDMDMDILSAIVGRELQQYESQGLPGWCHLLL